MKKLILVLLYAISFQVAGANLDAEGLARNFYQMVLTGDTESILSAFSKTPNIDTPRTGGIYGQDDFTKFLADEKAWLQDHGVDATSLSEIKTTRSENRIVYEQRITLNNTAPVKQHNFAVVVDIDNDKASAVRIYYSLNSITGKNDFSRPSMLENDPSLLEGIAPPVKQYVGSIDNAYRDVYRMFTDDGCFGPFCGTNRAKFFVIAMHAGSVPLRLATATCDDVTCALEENLSSWGETKFSINTAGLAVYDYNDKGQLTSARVYDDIHDAPFSEPGWFARHWPALSEGFTEVGCPLNTAPAADDPANVAWAKIMMQPCASE